jgi:hypothetical protein
VDFIVSKVALSVCALLTVAVLSNVFDRDRFVPTDAEVRRIVNDLRETIDSVYGGGTEKSVSWPVPRLPDGKDVSICITGGLVRGDAEGYSFVAKPIAPVHTWAWDEERLNESLIKDLDNSSEDIHAVSGEVFVISSIATPVDNDQMLLVFVRKEA